MGDKKKKKSRMDEIKENWDAFKLFLYDGEAGTVMGRDGRSWTKIMIFYLFYYGFLACLFAISITIVLNSLDEYTPRYQTRIQTPGVAIQPKLPSDVEQTSAISYSMKDPGSYGRFTKVLDEFLWKYDRENQTDLFEDCTDGQPPKPNQEYPGDTQVKSCRVNRDQFGPCKKSPYGYDVGKPCVFVKVNRIIKWTPVGYTDLSEAKGTDSNAPPLTDVLQAYGLSYKPYLMYTTCFGQKDEDKKRLGKTTDTQYYPKDMGIPFAYYPYYGKKRQPSYINPLVAVQFNNVTVGQEVKINCKVYAKNLLDDKDMQQGFFNFKLTINE